MSSYPPPPPAAPLTWSVVTPDQVPTVGRRVAARLLDGLTALAVYVVIFVLSFLGSTVGFYADGLLGLLFLVLLLGIAIGVPLLKSATLGQLVLGLRCVSVDDGAPAGGRTLAKYLLEGLASSLSCGLLLLIALVTLEPPLRRSWFDKLTGLVVVHRAAVRAPGSAPTGGHPEAQSGLPSYAPAPWEQPAAPPYAPAPWEQPAAPVDAGAAAPSAWTPAPDPSAPAPPWYSAPEAAPQAAPQEQVPPPSGSWAPPLPPAPDAPADLTVFRPAAPLGATSGASTTPTARLVLDSGEEVAVTSAHVVGRDPVAPLHRPDATVHGVRDDTRSLSKTHFLATAGSEPGTVWLTDLNSTNGMQCVAPDGRVSQLTPGVPTSVSAGTRITIGSRGLRVER